MFECVGMLSGTSITVWPLPAGLAVSAAVVGRPLLTPAPPPCAAVSPCSTSLSHPNVCQSYKSCVVQVLPDAGGLDGCGIAADSASSPRVSPSTGTFKVVSSLTDRNTLVRVMDPGAVLEPG